jgi:type IV secretory pathway VirJ component
MREFLATDSTGLRDVMVVFLTGDGGFRKFETGLIAGLQSAGIPVLGWNSLAYYRTRRTPEEAAGLLNKALRQYPAEWQRRRVVLVGYSFGADVMPFLVNRLDPAIRARLAGIALLSFGGDAAFQFHIGDWFGKLVGPTLPTVPELKRMPDLPLLCLYGEGDKEEACRTIERPQTTVVPLSSGHKLTAATREVAEIVAQFIRSIPISTTTARSPSETGFVIVP